MQLTPEQHLDITKIYFQNLCSVCQTYRAFCQLYGAHNYPSEQLICNMVDQFMTSFTLWNNIHPYQAHTVCIEDTITTVDMSVT